MGTITWCNQSIRPYESLFILFWRFIWLNRPSKSDIAKSLFSQTRPQRRVDLVFGSAADRSDALAAIRELLGISSVEWERAILYRNTAGDNIFSNFRYCLKCMEKGYHTAIFQLPTLVICPEHLCELICECPDCGEQISTELNQELLNSPFVCNRCGREFVSPEVLIKPPSIPEVPGIAAISEWYTWTARFPRIEQDFTRNRSLSEFELHPQVLPFIEIAGQNHAPDLLFMNRNIVRDAVVSVVKCGIRTAHNNRLQHKVWWYEPTRQRNDILLYKSYRRHLEKLMPYSRRIIRAFAHAYDQQITDYVKIPAAENCREEKLYAYALLLFTFSAEGWGAGWAEGLRGPLFKENPEESKLHANFPSLLFWSGHPHDANQLFRCSLAEREWLLDHFAGENLRRVFEAALSRASEMVRTGRYLLIDLFDWDTRNCEYTAGTLDVDDALSFSSIRVQQPPMVCGDDQEQMDYPKSARIMYLESKAISASENRSFSEVRHSNVSRSSMGGGNGTETE